MFLQDTPQAANIYSWHSIHTHTHTEQLPAYLPTYGHTPGVSGGRTQAGGTQQLEHTEVLVMG